MTNNEMNLIIAESLEPKPLHYLRPTEIRGREATSVNESSQRAWKFGPVYNAFGYVVDYIWEPRDFINDPIMRDLLQEKLLELGWVIEMYVRPSGEIGMRISKDEKDIGLSAPRGRVWAEAYIKTRQLK